MEATESSQEKCKCTSQQSLCKLYSTILVENYFFFLGTAFGIQLRFILEVRKDSLGQAHAR